MVRRICIAATANQDVVAYKRMMLMGGNREEDLYLAQEGFGIHGREWCFEKWITRIYAQVTRLEVKHEDDLVTDFWY